MTAPAVERDLVVVACAISAGVHGALVHEHFAEGVGAGTGFLVSTIALAVAGAAITYRPRAGVLAATAALFAGLLASYALATTTGFPVLHPGPEPVDALALTTKAVETLGLLASLHLLAGLRAPRRRRPGTVLDAKGLST